MSQDEAKRRTQRTARTGLSERQKMQMGFWARLTEYFASQSSTVRATAPQPQSFNNMQLGEK